MRFLSMLFILLVVAMFFTNPSREDFGRYAIREYKKEDTSDFQNVLAFTIGHKLVESSTSRKDFVLFSIFEFEIPNTGQRVCVFGCLNSFTEFKVEEVE